MHVPLATYLPTYIHRCMHTYTLTPFQIGLYARPPAPKTATPQKAQDSASPAKAPAAITGVQKPGPAVSPGFIYAFLLFLCVWEKQPGHGRNICFPFSCIVKHFAFNMYEGNRQEYGYNIIHTYIQYPHVPVFRIVNYENGTCMHTYIHTCPCFLCCKL
jgi:hypothetical protein